MPIKLKSIYGYQLYREYLTDFYQYQKSIKPQYSYQQFAKVAELNSPNYFYLVMSGKRNLTVANIHQFAKALGLFGNEREYFEALVLFNQAEQDFERKYYKQRLMHLESLTPKKQVKVLQRSLLREWYFPAVLLCLRLPHKEGTQVNFIAKKLNLNPGLVEDAIKLFLSIGVVEETSPKNYVYKEDHFLYADPQPNIAQRHYLKNQLQLALNLFDRLYDVSGTYFSHTFTGPENFKAIDKIMALIEELTKEADKSEPQRVYQLNFQFFPVDNEAVKS